MDIFEDFQKTANKSALLSARVLYNERVAPFVQHSTERLSFAKKDIDKIISEVSSSYNADPDYVRGNLNSVIMEEMKAKIAESEGSDDKRYREKGIGVDGEHVKEDLTNAGDSFNPFKEQSDGNADKGVGVPGGNDSPGEEAVTEADSITLEFDNSGGEKADEKGIAGGPENPPSEVKDPSERPTDIEETDVSYHNGPVKEDEARDPDESHDLKENTFKWTKVEDKLIIDQKKK